MRDPGRQAALGFVAVAIGAAVLLIAAVRFLLSLLR
jgi:hypothetical protein